MVITIVATGGGIFSWLLALGREVGFIQRFHVIGKLWEHIIYNMVDTKYMYNILYVCYNAIHIIYDILR